MFRSFVTTCVIFSLTACASAPDNGPEASLCSFEFDRPDNQLVGHILPSGQYAPGELNVEVFREWSETIGSAMARPNKDVYRREFRDDCHNKEGNYWYPCYKTIEVDLSDIRGIGRALNLDQAGLLAIRRCERLTKKRAPKIYQVTRETPDLQCSVSYRISCPLKGQEE